MKKFFDEFKTFIAKGNVVDMAVGVIIGGAFGKIVTSVVNDVIMPLVGLLLGGVNISKLKWVITPATDEVAEVALNYGSFLQTVLDFLIIALCIFIMLKVFLKVKDSTGKLLHKKKAAEEEAPVEEVPPPETETDILKDIRALLQEKEK
ncbi:MAG: large-conductance mechanosensitive channel protein MscL [Clostridia bacterium]|jgi:large conductance mechanosensitive channel|nr:large-conductance mechanosensitive channel protein MscL [Clostridia bacterium]